MHRLLVGFFLCGAATFVLSQPPEDGGGKKKDKDGKGPPGFKVGKVFPRHVREAIDLTDEQKRKVDELEDEVRQKLEKILTVDQFRHAESIGPPPGPPRDGPPPPPMNEDGGPPRGKKERPRQDPPPAKERPAQSSRTNPPGGIQWFATWESGLDEATRTGKPILLVSAAPHCAGVSGIW
jgi:hypothetical protein